MCQVLQRDYVKTLFLLTYLIKYIKAGTTLELHPEDAAHLGDQLLYVDEKLRTICGEIKKWKQDIQQYRMWKDGLLKKLARAVQAYGVILDILLKGECSLATFLFSPHSDNGQQMKDRIQWLRQLHHEHLEILKALSINQSSSEMDGVVSDAEYEYLLREDQGTDK